VGGRGPAALREVAGEAGPRRLGGLGRVEVEQDLARLGLPASRAVLGHDPVPVDGEPDGGQGPALGELLPQTRERPADAARRKPGLRQATGRAGEEGVLEGEEELALRAALGGQDPGADVTPELAGGHSEKTANLFRGVARHRVSGYPTGQDRRPPAARFAGLRDEFPDAAAIGAAARG